MTGNDPAVDGIIMRTLKEEENGISTTKNHGLANGAADR
jgi:hypothetical protein